MLAFGLDDVVSDIDAGPVRHFPLARGAAA
jgi:hypothetical protein